MAIGDDNKISKEEITNIENRTILGKNTSFSQGFFSKSHFYFSQDGSNIQGGLRYNLSQNKMEVSDDGVNWTLLVQSGTDLSIQIIAGENIPKLSPVYLDIDGKVYLNGTNFIGYSSEIISSQDTGSVKVFGELTGFTGLTPNTIINNSFVKDSSTILVNFNIGIQNKIEQSKNQAIAKNNYNIDKSNPGSFDNTNEEFVERFVTAGGINNTVDIKNSSTNLYNPTEKQYQSIDKTKPYIKNTLKIFADDESKVFEDNFYNKVIDDLSIWQTTKFINSQNFNNEKEIYLIESFMKAHVDSYYNGVENFKIKIDFKQNTEVFYFKKFLSSAYGRHTITDNMLNKTTQNNFVKGTTNSISMNIKGSNNASSGGDLFFVLICDKNTIDKIRYSYEGRNLSNSGLINCNISNLKDRKYYTPFFSKGIIKYIIKKIDYKKSSNFQEWVTKIKTFSIFKKNNLKNLFLFCDNINDNINLILKNIIYDGILTSNQISNVNSGQGVYIKKVEKNKNGSIRNNRVVILDLNDSIMIQQIEWGDSQIRNCSATAIFEHSQDNSSYTEFHREHLNFSNYKFKWIRNTDFGTNISIRYIKITFINVLETLSGKSTNKFYNIYLIGNFNIKPDITTKTMTITNLKNFNIIDISNLDDDKDIYLDFNILPSLIDNKSSIFKGFSGVNRET